eukprot:tig00001041_g6546.t1
MSLDAEMRTPGASDGRPMAMASAANEHGLPSPPASPAPFVHLNRPSTTGETITTRLRLPIAGGAGAGAFSERRHLYESLEGLKTMRSRLGTPPNQFTDAAAHLRSAETSLSRRQWREGAGSLLVSLAHNGGDIRASASFRGAVHHIFRNRPFFEPGRKRETVDYGPPQRRERAREERPAPKRTIIDDFPEVWRQSRMGEVLKSRGTKSSKAVEGEGAAAAQKAQEDELEELRQLMHKSYYIPLRTIFRYYARLDGAKVKTIAVRSRKVDNDEMYTVSKHEFDAFVTDCKIISGSSSKHLSAPKVNLIFINANKEGATDTGPAGQATLASDANTRLTMVLPEFLNAVVRLAEARYAREGRSPAGRLSLLMENNVLPHARWDDVEEFRRLLRHPTVQEAVAAARPQIRLLFEKYCGLDSLAARAYGAHKNKSVSIREFVAMFEDLGLLRDRALSQKDVQDAFATAQADPVIDDDVTQADDHGADCMEELNAVEFEEAIIRCAVARHCAEKDLQSEPMTSRAGAPFTSRSFAAKSFRSIRSLSSRLRVPDPEDEGYRYQEPDGASPGPVRVPPAGPGPPGSDGEDGGEGGEEGDGGTGMPPEEVALAVARFFEVRTSHYNI